MSPDYKTVSCMATDAFRSVSSACKAKLSKKKKDPVGFMKRSVPQRMLAGEAAILSKENFDLTAENGKKKGDHP